MMRARKHDVENPPNGWEECGSCSSWHPPRFKGDCRDDANRWPSKACIDNLRNQLTKQATRRYEEYRSRWQSITYDLSNRVTNAYYKDLFQAVLDRCLEKVKLADLNGALLEEFLQKGRITTTWNSKYVSAVVAFCIPGLTSFEEVKDPKLIAKLCDWVGFTVEPPDDTLQSTIDQGTLELDNIRPYISDIRVLRRLVEHAPHLKLLFPNMKFDRFTSPAPRPDPFPVIDNILHVLTIAKTMQIK